MSSNVYNVHVKTGDVKDAGTNANVTIVIYDVEGNVTPPIPLDNFFRNEFERGQQDLFTLKALDTQALTDKPDVLELRRDNSGLMSQWYLESVTIEKTSDGSEFVFPFNRWVEADKVYKVPHLDTFLPKNDPFPDMRAERLKEARKIYQLSPDNEGPARVEKVPPEEKFSTDYKSFLLGTALKATIVNIANVLEPSTWSALSQIELNSEFTGQYYRPPCLEHHDWRHDWWFGYQRLCGPDPTVIRLCCSIPDNLGVTEDELRPFLEEQTPAEVMAAKRLFVCDLKHLQDFRHGPEGRVLTAPLALLFVNKEKQLLPIAIQLFQQPGADNPVFLPTDDEYTWLLAKMWYNVAEANSHQVLTHLHFTHLLMESFCLAANRELSGNHPIFRLLKPHFMFLLEINAAASTILMSPGGLFDKVSAVGHDTIRELGIRGLKEWRVDVEGTLPEALKARGVLDADVLPNYHYREDGLQLYDVVKKYATAYINLYYPDDKELQADYEVQAWAAVLAKPRAEGGYGIHGLPLTHGALTSLDQLALLITSVIFTCSVGHAAVNFPQYDQFGYAPNYPFVLLGDPPTDKLPRSEEDVAKLIGDKNSLLMRAVSLFTSRGNARLGTPLGSFIVDPPAVIVGERFQRELETVEKAVLERNKTRKPGYDVLNPALIPNSISI